MTPFRLHLSAFTATLALMSGMAAAQPGGCAQWAMTGDIRTAPGDRAQAVVIEGDRVVDAGTLDLTEGLAEDCVLALPDGAVAFPGLVDGHAHLIGIGLRELTLNLDDVRSIAQLKDKVADAATGLDDGEPIVGRGWIETGWPEDRMPVAADIDAVVSDRPVILMRADGHAAVVNSAALEAAGVSNDTPDPDGGLIERNEEGEATGLLIDMAMDLVASLEPVLTEDRRREALAKGATVMANRGWTGVHNMSVAIEDRAILEELAEAGSLPIRVVNYLVPDALDQMVEEGRSCVAASRVCTNGIKFYADGALGSRGALLERPYTDAPETRGLMLMEPKVAIAAYKRALEADLQVTTHAIGDKGNAVVLGWYRNALEGRKDTRWRIEHAQVLRPSDIPRFAFHNVIASMQPSHAIGDLHFAGDRLGPERLEYAYAWKSMVDAGVTVVGGSDAPVEVGDPIIELHAATRRFALDGFEGPDWHPEQALPTDEALKAFTVNPAFAAFRESELGQLAPGFRADISVFVADPFTTPWDDNRPLMTFVDGVQVSGN